MIRLFFYPHFTEGELRHRKAKEFDAILKKKELTEILVWQDQSLKSGLVAQTCNPSPWGG